MEAQIPGKVVGRIHSLESAGTLDGPGIRFVIFTQGCPLRCQYCHNPDCQDVFDGREVSVDELIDEVQKYRTYMAFSGGGVTVTGGEPLIQRDFVKEIFRRCQELDIHTTLDTSGFVKLRAAKPVLEHVDLVLLDIKSFLSETYMKVTGVPLEPTLELARYLNEINKPTWIRFVLVPKLTDDPENVEGLAKFVSEMKNVEKVDVLPFHKMGEYKWQQLGMEYQLKDTPTPTAEDVERVTNIFKSYGLTVH